MGRGRAPCCDKNQVKRGPWSPSEDQKLIYFIRQHGHSNWRALPRLAGLSRCGKSCRLRWINYLRPDVKRGNFTKEEEETIIKLHHSLGNKWSKIASHLPGRTDNEIKNVWNTYLKKRLSTFNNSVDSNGEDSRQETSLTSSSSSYSSPHPITACSGLNGYTEKDDGSKEEQEDVPGRTTCPPNNSLCSLSHGSDGSNVSDEIGGMDKDGLEKVDPFSGFTEEVNKPEAFSGSDLLEIPFEFDADFWNMLDNLGTSPPFQATETDQLREVDAYRDTRSGGPEIDNETAENDNWLQYLENELGLVEPAVTEDDNSKHPRMHLNH